MKTHLPIRTLLIGAGRMGISHAKAYLQNPGFELVGMVSRTEKSLQHAREALGVDLPVFLDAAEALSVLKPDAACIATYPDTHARYARQAMEAGAHVFLEKPLAETVAAAEDLAATAARLNRRLVVGYILRHHPSWARFVEEARTLGKPLVMRMNLNQQNQGDDWITNRNLLHSLSPIVDCGVHYLDMMCLMTGSRPTFVQAVGARLTEEIPAGQYNYGCLQVGFEDGSIGWYEAGWGPMMSQESYFIKDVIGPLGSASLVAGKIGGRSEDIEGHTKTGAICKHDAALGPDGRFTRTDLFLDTSDEPDHDGLCALEQDYFLSAIRGEVPLEAHIRDAVNSLRIALAADRSIRENRRVEL